jgi:UDP-N-acetylmuramoylalanine--D-glutamate ligase
MKHLAEHRALILGLGDSGLAMARWLGRFGAPVQVWDSREAPPQAAALHAALPQATLSHANFTQAELVDAALQGITLVLKSPGLAPTDARIAPLLERAAALGLPIQGELDLFSQALADLKLERGYAPKVLAITGTNGKTTTTSLTALLVARAGRRVGLAGNIGPTLLQTLSDALDAQARADAACPDSSPADVGVDAAVAADVDAEADVAVAAPIAQPLAAGPAASVMPEVWVLELSSFQLHGVEAFEPDAAVVLNLTEDHLDWHGSMAAYAADKARIYGKTGVMVVNRDDPVVERMVPPPPAPVPAIGRGKGRFKPAPGRTVVRFGLDAPRRAGDFGWVVEHGMAWLVRAMPLDDAPLAAQSEPHDTSDSIILQRLMPADALRIRGRHNAANALAALALATAIGCPLAPMLHGLRDYAGEPHRVQHLARIDEVDFIDDSKGTNVGATVAAIHGLAQDRSPAKLVLILGGDGKGQDFSPLRDGVARHARAVALIGQDAPAIAQALSGLGLPMQHHDSLQAATVWAASQAERFDAVVLSPACASLDMFRNYAHRAEVFAAQVQAIAEESGGLA